MFLWQSYHLLTADQDRARHAGTGTVRAFALVAPCQKEGTSSPLKHTVPSQVESTAEEVGGGEVTGWQETDCGLRPVPVDGQWGSLQGPLRNGADLGLTGTVTTLDLKGQDRWRITYTGS